MLRLFSSKTFSPVFRQSLPQLTRPTNTIIQKRMVSSQRTNEDLKVGKLFDVSHVTAVVTGGGTGIGLMITQALQSNGAKVYITGRREEALDKVVEQYSTGPGKIIACVPSDASPSRLTTNRAPNPDCREISLPKMMLSVLPTKSASKSRKASISL